MPTLAFDQSLFTEIDLIRSFLARDEWAVVSVSSSRDLIAQVAAIQPDVLVLSDRVTEPGRAVEELARRSDLQATRILIVTDGQLDPATREALAGAGVRVVDPPVLPRFLADAIATAAEVETRVTLRAEVVFEIQGRSESNGVLQGQMLDISTGGFRLRSEQKFDTGELIYCFFYLPSQASTIFATARISRIMPRVGHPSEYGLAFVDIRLQDRRHIAEFVVGNAGFVAQNELSGVFTAPPRSVARC